MYCVPHVLPRIKGQKMEDERGRMGRIERRMEGWLSPVSGGGRGRRRLCVFVCVYGGEGRGPTNRLPPLSALLCPSFSLCPS